MEAKELRIGNLVNYGVNVCPIKSIHTESVLKNEASVYIELNQKLNHYCVKLDEIQPIPLTEEWLVKFGFNEINFSYYFENIELYFQRSYQSYFFKFGFEPNEKKAIQIKYVHQLQNLYFALTGEELTLKQ